MKKEISVEEAIKIYSEYVTDYLLLNGWFDAFNNSDFTNKSWFNSKINKMFEIKDKQKLLNNITRFMKMRRQTKSYNKRWNKDAILTSKTDGKYDWLTTIKKCYQFYSNGKFYDNEAKKIYNATGKKIDYFHHTDTMFIDEIGKMKYGRYQGDILNGIFIFENINAYSDNFNFGIYHLTNKLLDDIFQSLKIGKTRNQIAELYTIRNYHTLFNLKNSPKSINSHTKEQVNIEDFEKSLNNLLLNYEKFILAKRKIKKEVNLEGTDIFYYILKNCQNIINEIMTISPVTTSWKFVNYSKFEPYSQTHDLFCITERIRPPHIDGDFIKEYSWGIYVDRDMNLWKGEINAGSLQEVYEMTFKPITYQQYCSLCDSPITDFITNILFRLGEHKINVTNNNNDINTDITEHPKSQLGLKIKTFIEACHTMNFNNEVIKIAQKMLMAIPQIDQPREFFLNKNELEIIDTHKNKTLKFQPHKK